MQQVVLRAHPRGAPVEEDFELQAVPAPGIGGGEVLLRTLWLALDPLIRFTLDAVLLTGVAKVRLGEVVYGPAVSEVVASRHADFQAGELVEARTGWREYAAVDPQKLPLHKIDVGAASPSSALGVLGMPGRTAHAAMITIGRVQAGETVVVSAAAGAVGSTAGQIGRLLGARVVGIAGGPDKCRALLDLGFDACIDYRAADFPANLAAACQDGVHVYIESVGGDVTRTVLPLLKYGARMPVCGYIAYYGLGMEGPGPDRLPGFMRMVMAKGLEVRGFASAMIPGDAALEDLARWVRAGRLRCPESVMHGLAAAPAAFASVFRANTHIGKLLVKVADPGGRV